LQLLVDDIIGSGQTIINAIDVLKSLGTKSIEVIATHNLIEAKSSNLDKILSKINKLSISNSVQTDYKQLYLSKMQIVDISAPIINCIKSYF
jgi:phosphoribosylpyrophosphate synthetase